MCNVLILKNDTDASYWRGFVLSGIIPLILACVGLSGAVQILFHDNSESGFKYNVLGAILFSLIALIFIMGHHFVYRKVYSSVQLWPSEYQSFRHLFFKWLSLNSIVHILGVFIFLIIAATGSILLNGTEDVANYSFLSGATGVFLKIVLAVFVVLIQMLFFGIMTFFLFSLPVTFISTLIFRFSNFTRTSN